MSQSNSGDGSQTGTTRFPAPRPRASQPTETISAVKSGGSGASAPPRPRAAPRPSAPTAPSGQRSQATPTRVQPEAAAPAQQTGQGERPAAGGKQQPQLVRPTPKAKVRKARLLVSKVDPWSVLKMSFLLSVALGIMTVVSAVSLYVIMDITGIFGATNELAGEVLGTEEGEAEGFAVEQIVTVGQVASFATIIAVVNVLLLTVISMLAAVLYNLSASLVGGIGVTLTDD